MLLPNINKVEDKIVIIKYEMVTPYNIKKDKIKQIIIIYEIVTL